MKIIALFNDKIQKGVKGRSQTFKILQNKISNTDKVLWFHCASLGEYEQGVPVFEKLRELYPEHKVLLSFFSPSGYEVKKNTPLANVVVYLPLDKASNARQFLELSHPEVVVFVKYEIWPNYLKQIKERNIKSILISAVFREDQSYFKAVGKWMLKYLRGFDHIFVQNKSSKAILINHGIDNVSISGDTRFDRVYAQLSMDNELSFMSEFLNGELCVVVGSSWPEDDALFIDYINAEKENTKYLIAPHNIKEQKIDQLCSALDVPIIKFSEKEGNDLSTFKVMVVDTIGLLSKLYSYASIAYVGGAMGTTGLHNTLEAAVFGVPILIGPNYDKFPEAHDMISDGGMIAIKDRAEFSEVLNSLISNEIKRKSMGKKNGDYIEKNRGAVIQILNYLRK